MSGLPKIKKEVYKLKAGELSLLGRWIHQRIQQLEEEREKAAKVRRRSEAIEERAVKRKTYRLEKVRCGKEGCKCSIGEMHGPYWYAYWSEKGRTRSQYIGKKLSR